MTARKATKTSPLRAPQRVSAGGEPIGRWAKVLADAQKTPGLVIEPFEVHEGLTLYPMTPARHKKYGDAQLAYFAAVGASANASRNGATQDEVNAITKQRDEALQAYNEALYGEREYPLVEAYFADQGAEIKDLFVNAVRNQFLRLPDDGGCLLCGHVDEETAGKDNGSSGTSSTTGPTSTETSPTTSEE